MIANRRAASLLLAMSLGVYFCPALLAQEGPPPPDRVLIKLNAAIEAYLARPDEAEVLFQELLGDPAAAEYHVSCHYYLGLIALKRGLAASDRALTSEEEFDRVSTSLETLPPAEQESARQRLAELETELREQATMAQSEYERARDQLSRVVATEDQRAEVVSAALLLGIAQLAVRAPEHGPRTALELAQDAEETLRRYVAGPGATDRYGWFYLAVTQYRLADEHDRRNDAPALLANIRSARENLLRARDIARDEFEQDQATLAYFEAVTAYYDALLEILADDYSQARRRFADVLGSSSDRVRGSQLAKNAERIQNKLEEAEIQWPAPIELPVPAPIGPFEFEARIITGFAYDTNVVLLGGDALLPFNLDDESDFQLTTGVDLDISRHFKKKELGALGESLTLGVGGGMQHLWNCEITEFDVNRYPARSWINWQPVRDVYLGLQYEYSYTQLGHDPFISSQRITPVLSKFWRGPAAEPGGYGRELGRTVVYYTHDERNYLDILDDRRLNRDGQYTALGAQQQFNILQARELPYLVSYYASHPREAELLGYEWLAFRLGYEYRDEDTVGSEFDMRGHTLVFGLDVPLPLRLSFNFGGEWSWDRYTSPSIFDYEGKKRRDFTQRYDFGFTYAIVARGENESMRTLDVKLRAGVETTFQDSNIWNRLGEDIYSYDRAVYGAQLEVRF